MMKINKTQKALLITTSIMLIVVVLFNYTGLAKWTEIKIGPFSIVPLTIGIFITSLFYFLEKRFNKPL